MNESWLSSDVLSEDEQRRASAYAQGVQFVLLQKEDIDPQALLLIPEAISRKHSAVAYRAGEAGIEVALLDMKDAEAVAPLRERARILLRLTDRASMTRALIAYQKYLKETYGEKIKDDAHPSRALVALLTHAASQHASDIHLERRAQEWLVRYRVQGALYDAMKLASATGIISELKARASLSQTLNAAQEGKFSIEVNGHPLVVRVSTMPTATGERVALRLIGQGAHGGKGFTLEALGFHGNALELLHHALNHKTGLVAVSGPAHSGKSSLLYTLLDLLAAPSRAIATLEEYIEHRLPFASQTETRKEIGLTFASGLRALMRQDPDVVMLGNISSHEVGLIAHSAARRALVVGALEDESLVAPDVLVRVRLVDVLCSVCKKTYDPNRAELDALETHANFGTVLAALRAEQVVEQQQPWKHIKFYTAAGCNACEGGYAGRIGLQEVVCEEGESLNLIEDGVFKAVQGIVDIRDIALLAKEIG